jgi:hypothetical protein
MDILFQIQAVGWPEAITDVSHHAGLLLLWHGAVHHVPVQVPAASAGHLADFAGGTGVWGHFEAWRPRQTMAVGHSQAAVSRSSGQCGDG